MAFESENQHRKAAREIVDKIAAYNSSNLSRIDLGTALNFEDSVPLFENCISFFKEIASCDFSIIPIQKINEISAKATLCLEILDKIREFTIHKYPNALEARSNLINGFQSEYYSTIDKIGNLPLYFKSKDSTREYLDALEKAQKEANELIAAIRLERKQIEIDKKNIDKELLEILETSRQTVSKIGVSAHAVHFSQEADQNLKSAKLWMIALITLIAITLIWGGCCFSIHPPDSSSSSILQYTISKLIILSGLYFALSMVTKNYKAQRHNYVVNRHKQNSLNTFEAFVKGSGDDQQTKNAILISATQSIFSSQASGYSSADVEPEPNKIIEIFKSVQTR